MVKGSEKTIAGLAFEMISQNPYRYTSDAVLFLVYAKRNDLITSELPEARESFFAKGQPGLRTSALGKRYGWGVHCDEKGKIVLYGRETSAYNSYLARPESKIVKAMQSKINAKN